MMRIEKSSPRFSSPPLIDSSRLVVNYENLFRHRQELICEFNMCWMLNVLLDSFCAFKCGLKDMRKPLMHVFYAHISSPANQRAHKGEYTLKQRSNNLA